MLTASRPYFALKPKAFDFLGSGFVEFIERGSLDVSRLRPLPPLRWLDDLISRYNMRLKSVNSCLSTGREAATLLQHRVYVQDWDGNGHNRDCGFRKSPNRKVDTRVGDIGISHVDDHDRLDDASGSSDGTQAHGNSHSDFLAAFHGEVFQDLPWDEGQYEIQDRRIVGGEQLELPKLVLIPAGSGHIASVYFLERCTFRETEDPDEVHRYVDLA